MFFELPYPVVTTARIEIEPGVAGFTCVPDDVIDQQMHWAKMKEAVQGSTMPVSDMTLRIEAERACDNPVLIFGEP